MAVPSRDGRKDRPPGSIDPTAGRLAPADRLKAGFPARFALTGFDTTVLHVQATMVPHGASSRHARLTPGQYWRLADYIAASFQHDADGSTTEIRGLHHDVYDAFFAARGRYSAFRTCNEWTRRGLAQAEVRVPVQAPCSNALLFRLPGGE